jgi:hypothetical protein
VTSQLSAQVAERLIFMYDTHTNLINSARKPHTDKQRKILDKEKGFRRCNFTFPTYADGGFMRNRFQIRKQRVGGNPEVI